jgi:hypothetical protein
MTFWSKRWKKKEVDFYCEMCHEPVYIISKRKAQSNLCYVCDAREEEIKGRIKYERSSKPRCE